MKRQVIAINSQLTKLIPEPNDLRPVADHRPSQSLQVNLRLLLLGILTAGLVSCAPAKPPAAPSPNVEATPIVTPTPSPTPSASPSSKPSTRSSSDSSIPDAPAERPVEPERSSDGGGSSYEAPVSKSKAAEPVVEKPQRTEKPAPAIEPDLPARAPRPSEVAPAPPAPKATAAPTQSDDPEPPS